MSFDAEFNADSENVHGFSVYFILKGLLGQKPCFLVNFWGLLRLLAEPRRLRFK